MFPFSAPDFDPNEFDDDTSGNDFINPIDRIHEYDIDLDPLDGNRSGTGDPWDIGGVGVHANSGSTGFNGAGLAVTNDGEVPWYTDANGNSHHPSQVLVHGDHGEQSSAFVARFDGLDNHGTISVIGVEHGIEGMHKGEFVPVSVPGYGHINAEITEIHANHDCFRAEIDATTALAIEHNSPYRSLNIAFANGVHVGTDISFQQVAGVPHSVLREGVISGVGDNEGNLLTLTGTHGGPGSSGSPVFDDHGRLVGQILAQDLDANVNLIASPKQLLSDLADFAAGRDLSDTAKAVDYGPNATAVMSDAEKDKAAASGRLGPAGGHFNEGHDSNGRPRGA